MSRTAIARRPCATCPFRKDHPIYLRRDRRAEIADAVRNSTFYCHETVDYDVEDDEEPRTSGAAMCAGAAKAVMADGGTNQMMRIAERLGLADLDDVEAGGAETWGLDEWTRLAEGATGDDVEWEVDLDEIETCSVVNAGCLAPAGFLSGGGAVSQGTEAADGRCKSCDEPVCSECLSPGGYCDGCARWEDPESDEYDEDES